MANKATKHSKQQYHQVSMTKMDEFVCRYSTPSQSVDFLVNSIAKQKFLENQCVIHFLRQFCFVAGAWLSEATVMIMLIGMSE